MRDILQREIDDYKKTKKQVKAIKKQNKLLKRKLIAKLVNMESNQNTNSQPRDSYGMQMPPYAELNESKQSLEESLLFEDFSSSSDSSD